MIGDLGENLIVLVCLPRSGSTLLQHLLAAHSAVGTAAEPWILFPAACALKPGALSADYDANTARVALADFLSRIDGGEDAYYAGVRRMARDLYNAHLARSGKARFVDKSARYYQALPEIERIFPKAQYVYLVRNPLAMFASYLDVMVGRDWRKLGDRGSRTDLLFGYRLIREAIDRRSAPPESVVRYEDLAREPERVAERICRAVGLPFEPGMVDYGDKVGVIEGKLKDPKSIHRHSRPVADYTEAWRERLATRQEFELARGMLDSLGPDVIGGFGYDFADLRAAVSGRGKGWKPPVPWQVVTTPPAQRGFAKAWWIHAGYLFQEKGLPATARAAFGKLFGKRREP